jgi:hypothetical protein
VLPGDRPFNRDGRTIGVLDHFERQPNVEDPKQPGKWITHGNVILNGPDNYITHGELITQGIEQQGYNALRLQVPNQPMSKVLADIYAGVKDGTIKLKPGSKLNISLGDDPVTTGPYAGLLGEPTYASVNHLLGLDRDPITPLNATNPAKVAQVLQAMDAKMHDPSVPAPIRARLKEALDTNKMVDKIQKDLGIDIIKAAGNAGPNYFSLDFLTAKQRLGATDQDGNLAPYSELGTGTGLGDHDIDYLALHPFSPKPIATGQGRYVVDGGKVTLDPSQYGGRRVVEDPLAAMNPYQGFFDPPQPGAPRSSLSFSAPTGFQPPVPGDGKANIHISQTRNANDRLDNWLDEALTGDRVETNPFNSHTFQGTSFSGAFSWIPKNVPRDK